MARHRIILFTLAVTVLTTLVVTLSLPKSYKSTATLLLSHKNADPVTGVIQPSYFVSGFMPTQIEIIKSNRTAWMVIDKLRLDQNEAARQRYAESNSDMSLHDWLSDLLLRNLEIETSKESSVLSIGYKAADPFFASVVANAFANAYQEISLKLTAEPLKKAASYFTDQLNILRVRLETAQGKLSQFQHEKGIIDVDSRLDVETRRLNDLSSQLVVAEAEVMGIAAQNSNAIGESNAVLKDTMISNLKLNLAQAEARFAEISQKLGGNHPSYASAKSEIVQLGAELRKHIKEAKSAVINRVAEIKIALEEQRAKVLSLNQARDELVLLTREVEGAQQAYNNAMQRLNQISLEGQSDFSSISIIDPAKVPDTPHSPKPLLNLLLSFILGALLGIAFSLLIEMFDGKVRCAEDLIDALQVPVLGIVKQEVSTQRKSRYLQLAWPRLLR